MCRSSLFVFLILPNSAFHIFCHSSGGVMMNDHDAARVFVPAIYVTIPLSDIVFCYLVCNIHYSVGRVSRVRFTLTKVFKYNTYFVMSTYIMIHLRAILPASSLVLRRGHLGAIVFHSRLWNRGGCHREVLRRWWHFFMSNISRYAWR